MAALPPLPVPSTATLTHTSPAKLHNLKTSEHIEISKTSLKESNVESNYLTIGRLAATVDIRLTGKSISRRHAVMYYDDQERLILQDLDTKKGCFVNQQRLGKGAVQVLQDGDTVRFGNEDEAADEFRVQFQSASITNNDKASVSYTENSSNNELLTGRALREAEIAAMTASLDAPPVYTTTQEFPNNYLTTLKTKDEDNNNLNGNNGDGSVKDMVLQMIKKHKLPVTRDVTLVSSSDDTTSSSYCQINAIGLDPTGARVVAGTSGGIIKFWDFGGMTSTHSSFRSIEFDKEVGNQCPIVGVSYSQSGDRFIVGTASAQPKVYDREGALLLEFDKGDVYIMDMSRTTGHCAAVTGVSWNPIEKFETMTCSLDGSARSWDVSGRGRMKNFHFGKLKSKKVYCVKNKKGVRTGVTSIAYHPSGKLFAIGTSCGSIQLWKCDRTNRFDKAIFDAHGTSAVYSVVFSSDGKTLASRGGDDAVQIWNTFSSFPSKPSSSPLPVAKFQNLATYQETANICFDPTGSILIVGTSVVNKKKQEEKNIVVDHTGTLYFFDTSGNSKEPLLGLPIAKGCSIVQVGWHLKLNQIFCALSNGTVKVLFDDDYSVKGALMSSSRVTKKKNALDELLESRSQPYVGKIITPALDAIHRANKRKRGEDEDIKPGEQTKPMPPASGIMTGGRTSASVNFTQFVVRNTVKNKSYAGKDPRSELFKYCEGKSFLKDDEKASVLAEKTVEEEEEEMKK